MTYYEKFIAGVGIAWDWVTDLVRKYPVKSFLASLAIGFALGYWVA